MNRFCKVVLGLAILTAIVGFILNYYREFPLPVIEPPPIPRRVNDVMFDSDLEGKYRTVFFLCDSVNIGHICNVYYPSREKLSLVTVSTHTAGINEHVEFKWSVDSSFLYFHELENDRRGICYKRDSTIFCYSISGQKCMLANEYDLYFENMMKKHKMLLPDTLDADERSKYFLLW